MTPAVKDPSSMTTAERLQEVSRLFATGYVRLLLAREESHNPLAERPESEPSCDHVVNRSETQQHEEAT